MADYKSLMEKLQALNPYEEIGRELYLQTGNVLRHGQYLYLTKHGPTRDTLQLMNTPAALREQGQIVAAFHERYGATGLTEQDFIEQESDIEVEQLLRYVEIPTHSHEFVECAFVLRGCCIHRIDENEVAQQEGSFLLVPVPMRHQLIAVEDAVCLTIKVRLSLFMKLLIPHLPSMIYPLSFQCGHDPAFESMLLFLYDQQQDRRTYHNELMENAFTCLITYILQNYRDTVQPLYNISIKDQRMMDMINYMYENYRTITLRGLAERYHYNESYLSRMFCEQAGRSFSETVKDFKLRKAAELLKTTDWKLDTICDTVGYKDTRQFIRSFKALFSVTPDKFRRAEKQRTTADASTAKF